MANTLTTILWQKYGSTLIPAYPELYAEQVRGLPGPDGEWFATQVTKPSPSKTTQQLRYYYGFVKPVISREFRVTLVWTVTEMPGTEWEWEREWDSNGNDDTDRFLKRVFAFGQNKARMSKEECRQFIQRCIDFANGPYLNCNIKDEEAGKENDNG